MKKRVKIKGEEGRKKSQFIKKINVEWYIIITIIRSEVSSKPTYLFLR